MERFDIEDVVDVGDAITETRGTAEIGPVDQQQKAYFPLMGGLDNEE